MKHNRWLAWKMKHGLAARGRIGGTMHPKGVLAGLLYKVYFKKLDVGLAGPRVFKQNVGGTVGSSGKVNGV